jgi:hypothetical protein
LRPMSSTSSACRCATGVRRLFGRDRGDDVMLTSAVSSARLLPRGPYLATTAPRVESVQRPSVLARPPHTSQQLSLFGPPGGRR